MNSAAFAAVVTIADRLAGHGVYPSTALDALLNTAIKTEGFYDKTLWRMIRNLYNGNISVFEFENVAFGLVSGQFRRAWNEGLREAGLALSAMNPGMENELANAIAQELGYLRGLVNDILKAKQNGSGFESFRHRAEMWANRYIDLRNRALVSVGKFVKPVHLEWVLGATEKHCSDCAGYAGQVHTAQEWDDIFRTTGHRPQSHDLECKGYECDCKLEIVEVAENEMLFAPAELQNQTDMLFAPRELGE